MSYQQMMNDDDAVRMKIKEVSFVIVVLMYRYNKTRRKEFVMFYVNIYNVGRAYGGPEEGGWYYDHGWRGETVMMYHTKKMAWYICNLLNSGGSFDGGVMDTKYCEAFVQTHPPKDFPEVRPHYE